ncbi:hypothetical protein PRIPAC_75104 [Pristionchus pacificus]|uniref:Uncharacterized protein n=1 Tax=Pristionchus pacificus TaxID=54126 RepID=A0A2A6C833_PRIPA|nr:hypothetical protein PRIPAC_75104 [Pristionchus pacificus]|eukprot:PDM74260.1 hypothetical protein PRIPAC_41616 [Pristionchus pacificus]
MSIARFCLLLLVFIITFAAANREKRQVDGAGFGVGGLVSLLFTPLNFITQVITSLYTTLTGVLSVQPGIAPIMGRRILDLFPTPSSSQLARRGSVIFRRSRRHHVQQLDPFVANCPFKKVFGNLQPVCSLLFPIPAHFHFIPTSPPTSIRH